MAASTFAAGNDPFSWLVLVQAACLPGHAPGQLLSHGSGEHGCVLLVALCM